MLALCVVHEGNGGLRDVREIGDLALVVHAQLDRAPAVRLAHAQERERQADVVVEVAGSGEDRAFALAAAQDGSEHLLHRGLAVRAHHGDERGTEAQPPVPRQRAERKPRIVDHGDRQRKLAAVVALDERRCGLRRGRFCKKLVSVEALAAQRDKKLVGAQRARIRRHAAEARIGPAHAAAEHRRRFRELHHARLLRASASRATAASENARRSPAISW